MRKITSFCSRVEKRTSDSFIGRDNFYFVFLGKVLKFVQAKINFFSLFDFWLGGAFSQLGQQLATFLSKNFAAP